MSQTPDFSRDASAKRFLIEQHYESMGDELVWDVNRLNRLCEALQLSHAELAAYIRVRPHNMNLYVRRNRFPKTIELHLLLIERATLLSSAPPVFPAL